MTINSGEGNYYTFRTQASYNTTLNKVHGIEAIAGYEYRQTFDRTTYNQMYGYDEQSLTNSTGLINFNDLINSESTDLGSLYSPQYSFLSSDVAGATHIKHKYQSYYATANYVYDSRYAASASYRVDELKVPPSSPLVGRTQLERSQRRVHQATRMDRHAETAHELWRHGQYQLQLFQLSHR